MSRERVLYNHPSGDLLPMAKDDPRVLTRSAHVKAVAEFASKNNRHYHKVEFTDGKSVVIFDAELANTIIPDTDVEYTIAKNEKSGYWDLQEIHEARPKGTASPDIPPSADRIGGDVARERPLGDREWGMRSMNALTNATTLLAALIEKDIVKPTGVEQAVAMVEDLHQRMMNMHEPAEPKP